MPIASLKRLGLSMRLGLLISSAGLGLSMAGLPSGALGSEPFVVRVGLHHSLQGTMRNAEYKLVEAEELAIAEINAAGGVLIKGGATASSTCGGMEPRTGMFLPNRHHG